MDQNGSAETEMVGSQYVIYEEYPSMVMQETFSHFENSEIGATAVVSSINVSDENCDLKDSRISSENVSLAAPDNASAIDCNNPNFSASTFCEFTGMLENIKKYHSNLSTSSLVSSNNGKELTSNFVFDDKVEDSYSVKPDMAPELMDNINQHSIFGYIPESSTVPSNNNNGKNYHIEKNKFVSCTCKKSHRQIKCPHNENLCKVKSDNLYPNKTNDNLSVPTVKLKSNKRNQSKRNLKNLFQKTQNELVPSQEYECLICSENVTSLGELDFHYKQHTLDELVDTLVGLSPKSKVDKENISHGQKISKPKPLQNARVTKNSGTSKRISDTSHVKIADCDRKRSSLEPHTCSTCGKILSSRGNLAKHLILHQAIKPWKCKICNVQFNAKRDLDRHCIQKHSTNRPHICSLCGKGFTSKSTLKEHKLFHQRKYSFKCPLCSKKFLTKKCVNRHLLRHGKNNKYTCTICSTGFLIKADLLSHRKLVHADIEENNALCSSKSFKTKRTQNSSQNYLVSSQCTKTPLIKSATEHILIEKSENVSYIDSSLVTKSRFTSFEVKSDSFPHKKSAHADGEERNASPLNKSCFTGEIQNFIQSYPDSNHCNNVKQYPQVIESISEKGSINVSENSQVLHLDGLYENNASTLDASATEVSTILQLNGDSAAINQETLQPASVADSNKFVYLIENGNLEPQLSFLPLSHTETVIDNSCYELPIQKCALDSQQVFVVLEEKRLNDSSSDPALADSNGHASAIMETSNPIAEVIISPNGSRVVSNSSHLA